MRAVAEDQEIASLMGIDVDRIVVTTFVIGGILAGIAGVLFALTFEQVNFFMGFRPGIAAFTAAVLGGIGSIGGAALGGFLLGLLQSVGPALLLTGIGVPSPFQLKDVVTFAVLVLVLIFRPGGLLGIGRDRRRSDAGRQRCVRTGLVGGIVVVYVALVGLLGEVRRDQPDRDAGDGRARRALVRAVPGRRTSRRARASWPGERRTATATGAAIVRGGRRARGGASVAIALLFTNWYGVDRVGEIFVQVNPALLEILSFGKSVPVGAMILTVGGRAGGAAGGAFRTSAVSVRATAGDGDSP